MSTTIGDAYEERYLLGKSTGGGNSAFHNIHNDYIHIADPNERRRLALAEIDKVAFGWNHVRAITVAGAGFFTDAYDLFSINAVTLLLGLVYWQNPHNLGVVPPPIETALKVATPVGTVFGMIIFGYLADRLGRKRMYGYELIIIIVSTVSQALSSDSPSLHILVPVMFWRIAMGVGVGGDYPLSAIISSEFASTKWRGAMIGSVFAMQGLGQFTASLVALTVTITFRSSLQPAAAIGDTPAVGACYGACLIAADRMWRIIVGFGALPGCLALYFRLTIPETPRYTFDVARDITKAERDMRVYLHGKSRGQMDDEVRLRIIRSHSGKLQIPHPSFADFCRYFGQWANFKLLLGTAASWFFLDIAFYGIGLNNAAVMHTLGFDARANVYEQLYNSNVGTLVSICAGSIPGYWMTVLLVDVVGRKKLQLGGFAVLTLLFVLIGFMFDRLSRGAFLVLFVLSQFFFNFGPNATTFIIPGELFPTRYRATAHGISSAAGKLGAITALAFDPLRRRGAKPDCSGGNCSPWLGNVMKIFALFMFCGLLTTLVLPETKRRSLEEITREQREEAEAEADALPRSRKGSRDRLSTPTPGAPRSRKNSRDQLTTPTPGDLGAREVGRAV